MTWFKENIKKTLNHKYIKKTSLLLGNFLLIIAFISIFFNYIGDYSYNINEHNMDNLDRLLSFRNSTIIIFTTVWLLSLILNKKLMVIIWLLAFSQLYNISYNIPDLCKVYAQEYCSDNNCNAEEYFIKRCK